MQPSDSSSSNKSSAIMELLLELREKLAQQPDAASLQALVAQLNQTATPLTVMHVLAPPLFQGDSNIDEKQLCSEHALLVLGFLVQSNPSLYLKPASQAIQDEATRLVTSTDRMVVPPALLQALIHQITNHGNNVQVAANATAALVACCRKLGPPLAAPALQALTEQWQQALDRRAVDKVAASTVAMRCATAVLDIVSMDAVMMEQLENPNTTTTPGTADGGILQQLLIDDMLQDDRDALLQMSVLDALEKLAHTRPMHHALALWLFSSPVLTPLLHLAGGGAEPDDEPDPILGGPALRVVAALCKLSQVSTHVFDDESSLLTGFHRALHNFEGAGELDRLAVMDAISSFAGASPAALELVLQDPVTRHGWLSLHVSQSKLKAAILVSVARVICPLPQSYPADDSNHHATSRHTSADLLKLYSWLGRTNDQESTSMLIKMGQSPMPEIRIAAYTLLQAVARLPQGGQVLLSSTANFIDFLLTRDEGEKTKEGREARFAIVQAIHDSPVKGLLADEIVKQIERYVAQGPHYVKTIPWELATES